SERNAAARSLQLFDRRSRNNWEVSDCRPEKPMSIGVKHKTNSAIITADPRSGFNHRFSGDRTITNRPSTEYLQYTCNHSNRHEGGFHFALLVRHMHVDDVQLSAEHYT